MLAASGCLMYAASSQRWSGACGWGQVDGARCNVRQDHRFDFMLPSAPWEPVGAAAGLAGWSLLVLATALVVLPFCLTGRRPHPVAVLAWIATSAAVADVGLATLRSGLTGEIVRPLTGDLAAGVWSLALPVLLVVAAVHSRAWVRAGAVSLFLATPLVAAFSYAIGPYDANPWWEAVSGAFTVAGGGCLLAAAIRDHQRNDAAAAAAPDPRQPALRP